MDIIRKRKKNLRPQGVAQHLKGGEASSVSSYLLDSIPAVNVVAPLVPSRAAQDFSRFDGWSPRKLKKELEKIQKEISKREKEQTSTVQKKQVLERSEEETRLALIDLFEKKQSLRSSYVNLLSLVHREARKYKRLQKEIASDISLAESKTAPIKELLTGLRARLVRNKKYLWEMRKSDLGVKLQAKLRNQQELSREIQILRAHKERILQSLQVVQRSEQAISIRSRRRGRVISGLDLRVLSQNLEHFGKKKDQNIALGAIESKKNEYRNIHEMLEIGIHELQQKKEYLLQERAKLFASLARVQEEKKSYVKPLKPKKEKFSWSNISSKKTFPKLQPAFAVFSIFALLIPGTIGAVSYANKGLEAKSFVLGAATRGVDTAKIAGQDFATNDLGSASQNLASAAHSFSEAEAALQSLGPIVEIAGTIPGLSQVGSANALIKAAKNISLASSKLTEVASSYSSISSVLPENLSGEKVAQDSSDDGNTFVQALSQTQNQVAEADRLLLEANLELRKASIEDLPQEYQEKLKPIFELLPSISSTFHTFAGFYGQLPTLFGVDQPRKYLLMFLNNNELRGPGGFLGSFGLMDVDEGKIDNIKVIGTYDPDGQFQERLYPPAPLRVINPRWFMRDVWYPDFPTTAEKVMDLYERSEGPSVDGAISFTPTIFENLLKITGPVEVPEQHATVNADNFLEVTQYKVEIDYDKKLNQPKKFLGDMMPHFIQKLMTLPQDQFLDVASVFADAMAQKQMQVYFKNPELQEKVKDAGLAGEMKEAPLDYLSIVNNNVLGNKTDLLITESVQHNIEISADGTAITELSVTRTHTGTNAWPSGRNREFISLYVPKNAKLLSYNGFDNLEAKDVPFKCDECVDDPLVAQFESGKPFPNGGITTYEQFGKTVFAGWQYLDPGETQTYTVKYELPFKVAINLFNPASTYSVLVQKQAGSLGSKYRLSVQIPQKHTFAALVPRGLQDIAIVKSGSNATFETRLTNDRFFGVVITQ